MILTIISLTLSAIAISILFAEAPLTLGLWLISITLVTSISISILTTKWFGIILFLIYVGGLLVMFSYFSAISPNQLTDIQTIAYTLILSITISISLLLQKYTPSQSNSLILPKESLPSIILAYPNILPLISAAIILFLAIVVVIKVAPKYQGPLRPFN